MIIFKQTKFNKELVDTIRSYYEGESSDKLIFDLHNRKKLTSIEMFEISYFIGRNGIVPNRIICLEDLQKGRYPFIEDMKLSLYWTWANLYMLKAQRDNLNMQKTIRFLHSQKDQFSRNLIYKGVPLTQKHINYLCLLNDIRIEILFGEVDKNKFQEDFDFDNIPDEYDFEVKQVDTTGLLSYYAYEKLNKILKFCRKDKGGKDDSKYVSKYLSYVNKMDDGPLKVKLTERLEYKRPVYTYTTRYQSSFAWEGYD